MSGPVLIGLASGGIAVLLSIDTFPRQPSEPRPRDGRSGVERAASLRDRGLEHGYNLDYAEALAAFREAIDADPEDSNNERLAAATVWMRLLYEQGAVTVEDYLGQARANIPRRKPSADLVAVFRHHLDRATVLLLQLFDGEQAIAQIPHRLLVRLALKQRLGRHAKGLLDGFDQLSVVRR